MGRQRLRQRQSARLYYKDHDHRDMILNDEYLNGVYTPDHPYEVSWRKYKKLSLLLSSNEYYLQQISIDVANKFVSFSRANWYSNFQAFGSNYIMYGGYLSKNGYDYKYVQDYVSQSGTYRYARRYGFDYTLNSSSRKITVKVVDFDWNTGQQYAGEEYIRTIEKTFDTWRGNLTPCGEAEDGLFFYWQWTERASTTYPYTYHHYFELYHVNNSGFSLSFADDWIDSSAQQFVKAVPRLVYCHDGVHCGVNSYRTNDNWGVRLWVSNDAVTWTTVDLIPSAPPTSGLAMTVIPVYRGGTWYFYVERNWNYRQYYKWELYTSTDLDTFTQVSLPDYIDIPVLGYEDGIHGDIDDADNMTVRIKLNTYDGTIPTDDEDTIVMNLWQNVAGSGTVEAQNFSINDGHINIDPPTEYVCGTGGTYDSWNDTGYIVAYYIDNMELQSSLGNFAFIHTGNETSAESQENHEYISPTDYIFGGNNNG